MTRKPGLIGVGAAVGACLFGLCALPLASQAQTAAKIQPVMSEGVAIIVNDEVISTYALKQRVNYLLLDVREQPSAEAMRSLQMDALQSLVDEKLQTQELRHQESLRKLKPGTLFVSDEEIDEYLAERGKANNMTGEQFLRLLESRGVSPKSVREQIGISLAWNTFMYGVNKERIRISPERVDSALREVAAAAEKPSYLISEIFIDAARTGGVDNAMNVGRQLIQLLQQNARFETLALQYSALPTAASGGDAGWMSTGELEPEVATVLEALRPGQVTQPIRTKDGVYLILLRERRAGGASAMVKLNQAAIPLPADATPRQVQEAQQQLVSVKSRAIAGCQSLSSAAQGARGVEVADLGEAEVKDLAPTFREAVGKLSVNQVSDPIRTPVGLHLIAVCSKTAAGAEIPSREEMRQRLLTRELAMIQRRELRNLRNAATITQPR